MTGNLSRRLSNNDNRYVDMQGTKVTSFDVDTWDVDIVREREETRCRIISFTY